MRGRLKEVLESVQVVNSRKVEEVETGAGNPEYYQKIFVPEVVEYTRGTDIERKIKIAMNRSQLYVGLFGNQYSDRTAREWSDAVDRGMGTLVYYYTNPPVSLKENTGTQNEPNRVYQFLMEEVKPRGILIRGNYDRIELRNDAELEDEIVIDLLAELTDMVRQYYSVQKAMSGYEG